MQALKALVIFMGVLIIAGMGLLVYGLMTRVTWSDEAAPAAMAPASPVARIGTITSNLPAGAAVASVSVDTGRAVVHVRLADGGAEIRLFDLATGTAMGTIQLKAAP